MIRMRVRWVKVQFLVGATSQLPRRAHRVKESLERVENMVISGIDVKGEELLESCIEKGDVVIVAGGRGESVL